MVDHITAPMDEAGIDHLITLLNSAQLNTMEIHTRIVHAKPGDLLSYEAVYHTHMKRITSLHRQFHRIKAQFSPTSSSSTGTSGSGTTPTSMRLPRLDLPSFDGSITEWMSFRDLFVTAVHNNKSLSDSQKLIHLKSALTGEAGRLVRSTIISDANYSIAWKQLQDRYQNDRELLFAVLRRLLSQQQLQGNSAAAVRSLVDTTKECISSLEVLSLTMDKTSNAILLFTTFQKLDPVSKELWEQSLSHSDIPDLDDLFKFLEQRGRALSAGATKEPARVTFVPDGKKPLRNHHTQASPKCKICNQSSHPVMRCDNFLGLSVPERINQVKKHGLCFNCLREGHSLQQCSSTSSCRQCNSRHHTLIHLGKQQSSSAAPPVQVNNNHTRDETRIQQTLLATALIQVRDCHGNLQLCRALLDGGSNASFVTEDCAQRLGLRRTRTNAEVIGLASAAVGTVKSITTVNFTPHHSSSESYTVSALIMKMVTGNLPSFSCDPSGWPHLKDLELADPLYFKPAAVDILLGSDVFWELIVDGKRSGASNTPTGIRSTLGWLVAGNLSMRSQRVTTHYCDADLDRQLVKFWEIESVPSSRLQSPEEVSCEGHFHSTHSRGADGRFTVALPFKHGKPTIGSSFDIAHRRFLQLEKRIHAVPARLPEYISFMKEYEQLGHMSPVPEAEASKPLHLTNFIPHHFVLKEESTTTKFRVVFDASAKSSSGVSLNEQMMVGPVIQDNLNEIIMRFRVNPIAFTADLEKMYRQINVPASDRDLQRILWRESPDQPLQQYRLNTVTYGTASAPYLATKVLQQLAEDEKESLPLAAAIASSDFYVDDMMSGAKNIDEAIQVKDELLQLMDRGQLSLRKWCSNSPSLIQTLPEGLRETKTLLTIDGEQSVKALGIRWNTSSDVFQFQSFLPQQQQQKLTRRIVLSEMSRLFDPIGWLSPVLIQAKIFSQSLWKLELGWDEALPEQQQQQWTSFKSALPAVDQIHIPRCIVPPTTSRMELAGFCDASEKAYAAVVFLLCFTENPDEPPHVSLVTSKTRVAPAKTISLPKLELCGAVLLAELITVVKKALKLSISNVRAWTDSTVTLGWIRRNPSELKTFVANRVTEIQSQIPSSSWFHVPGQENPADVASRGMDPAELAVFTLWWNGPEWLSSSHEKDPFPHAVLPEEEEEIQKETKTVIVATTTNLIPELSLLQRYSSFRRLIRVTCWILRFKSRTLYKKKEAGPLTPEELQSATTTWIKIIQQQSFTADINNLVSRGELNIKSKIISLTPFVDQDGVLRVGGRLRHSQLPFDQKTPVLLPRHSRLTDLIIWQYHQDNLHAGPQLLLSLLQQKYWIVRGRDAVRFVIGKCLKCHRLRAASMQQMMGDLPVHRVTPTRPFQTCGVDFAGPFLMRAIPAKSKVTYKAYLSIFVCFSTRAVHLEVVSALTTEAFLAAFRRFVSRRGRPSVVFSDNGTNFVGAAKELSELASLVQSQQHKSAVADDLSASGIQWKFHPPGAPHFGGLWEAGVKSVKYHLHRMLGETRLTFEELTTLMAQIESCLNSRPITAMSSDPSDLAALTPGHFLIGCPLSAVPDPCLAEVNINRLDRWQQIQRLQQQFWSRWSGEFLTRLQQRPKWMKTRDQPQINDLVLLKHERLPPQKCKLGRIIEMFPGADGLIRVASVRTADGILKRPIVKICLLPINKSEVPSESEVI